MPWYERDYNQSMFGGGGGGIGSRLSGASVVVWLLAINCVVFIVDALLGAGARTSGMLGEPANWHMGPLAWWGNYNIAQGIQGLELWRLVTYQFFHGGFFHLLFNMIVLFFFGPMMEQWWGSRRFVAFYLLCGISGAIVMSLLALVPNLIFVSSTTPLVGASGSIFGILIGAAVLFPHQRVMLLIPPIPMSMRTLALVALGIAVFAIVVGTRNAGGQAAHLGGALLGFVLVKRPTWLDWADRGAGVRGTLTQWKVKAQEGKWRKQQQRRADEQAEVDRILEKVKNEGLHRLSKREKKTLNRATERQRRAG